MNDKVSTFESSLEETIALLLDAACKKDTEKGRRMISEISGQLKSLNIDMADPGHFHTCFMYDVNNSLEQLIRELRTADGNDKLVFIYIHYGYLEDHIQRFHSSRCGSSGCADRSRHIIRAYLDYVITGSVPDDDFTNDHYWIPKFGTYQEWMDYCDGLFDFYYGRPEKYLMAYKCLMDCEIRKYEHIRHDWYVDIKGVSYFITSTFDANIKKPFELVSDGHAMYYILPRNKIADIGYEPAGDGFMGRHYVKVPENDVERVYEVSDKTYL